MNKIDTITQIETKVLDKYRCNRYDNTCELMHYDSQRLHLI